MSSESDQESTSLKARLKAKLKAAGVCESSDDEEMPQRKKSGLKCNIAVKMTADSGGSPSLRNGTNGASQGNNYKMKASNGIENSAPLDSDDDIVPTRPRSAVGPSKL